MSDEYTFNFSDLLKTVEQTTGFNALPANEYDVEIVSSEARKTGSGKSKIAVRYRVLSGPHQGRNVFNDHVLSPGNPSAMVIFFRHMNAYGLSNDFFAANPPLDAVAKELMGKKVRVRLGVRTWNDVERNSILQITPLTASGPGSLPSAFGQVPVPSPAPHHAPPPPLPRSAPLPPPVPAPAPPVAPPLPQPAAMQPPAPEPEPEPEAAAPEPERPKMPQPPPGMPF
jgi:Protein of unknown function (DUF669)